MNDVDLIPADYRQHLKLKRNGKRFLFFMGVLVLLIAGGRGGLIHRIDGERAAIQRLKTGEVDLLQQKAQFDKLRSEQVDLAERLEVLDVLRGGPPAERIFHLIERAINPSVWFTELTYVREGQVQNVAPQSGRPGYIVIVSNDENRSLEQPWKHRSRFEIRGQALTHSDLAEFVRRLLAQSGIADVYLLQTGSRAYTASQVIDYQLAVVIDPVKRGE